MIVAGAALALWFRFTGFDPQWRRFGFHYAAAGAINTAIPFTLWAYAALYLTTGELAVINATSPMFGALMGVLFLGERLKPGRTLGLLLGVGGVALITGYAMQTVTVLSVAAGLLAAACYGFIGVYIRFWAREAPARGFAVGTQVGGALVLLPFAAFAAPTQPLTPLVIWSVIILGVVCGAVGYVLYFRLLADVGATGALTVTYLIPLFAMAWGVLFLGEPITLAMAGGAGLVLAGTVLVLRG